MFQCDSILFYLLLFFSTLQCTLAGHDALIFYTAFINVSASMGLRRVGANNLNFVISYAFLNLNM